MNRQAEAIIAPAMVTARQPNLLTSTDEIGPSTQSFCYFHVEYQDDDWFILPVHRVIPVISDMMDDVYPLPSLNSLSNAMYITPNEYVIPSAKI